MKAPRPKYKDYTEDKDTWTSLQKVCVRWPSLGVGTTGAGSSRGVAAPCDLLQVYCSAFPQLARVPADIHGAAKVRSVVRALLRPLVVGRRTHDTGVCRCRAEQLRPSWLVGPGRVSVSQHRRPRPSCKGSFRRWVRW